LSIHYIFSFIYPPHIVIYTLSLHDALPISWNQLNDLTNLTDSAGNQIRFSYNDLGQKVAEADPDRGFWQYGLDFAGRLKVQTDADRKSTRLNSSHVSISYAVFCLKKKKKQK